MNVKRVKITARVIAAQQEKNAIDQRRAAAKNAHSAIVNGDIKNTPLGSIEPVQVVGATPEGEEVEVTVYRATYDGQDVTKVKQEEAQAWLDEQRENWTNRNRENLKRVWAKTRIARMGRIAKSIIDDLDNDRSSETVSLISDIAKVLNIANSTIGDNGEFVAIAEVKRLS